MKHTKDSLTNLVQSSLSIAEVLRKLGLNPKGGSHRHITLRIKKLEIDTSHWLAPRQRSRGLVHRGGSPKKTPDEILCLRLDGQREKSYRLRRALLEATVEYVCTKCRLGSIWCEENLTLEVDHKNRNWRDNRKENLRFLCPNCHSQQSTSTSGNKR